MHVRSSGCAMMLGSPFGTINRFANPQIECQLVDNLPFETQVPPTAQTVGRRNRKRVEYVVLVQIDPVLPFLRVKTLQPKPQT